MMDWRHGIARILIVSSIINTEPSCGTQTLTPTTYYKTVKSYYNGEIGIKHLKCLGWVMGK